MRTRTSNRAKRYIDFGDASEGSDDPPAPRVARRRQAAGEDDDDFEEDAQAEADAEDDEMEVDDAELKRAEEDEDDASDGPASGLSEGDGEDDGEGGQATPKPRGRAARRRQPRSSRTSTAAATSSNKPSYIPLDQGQPEALTTKIYTGPLERHARTATLLGAWYGTTGEGTRRILRILDRWTPYPVLPPKISGEAYEMGDVNLWAPQVKEKEEYFAELWLERVRKNLGATGCSALEEDPTGKYEMAKGEMTVLMGPYEEQEEVKFEAGKAHCISDTGKPLDEESDEATAGWMLDTGGIPLSLDWKPTKSKQAPQVLAIAVIPHADQEHYNFEAQSRDPDFQKFGTVQLWTFEGEDKDEDFVRPSKKTPRSQTCCFEFGRARRVKWNPVCGFLAVIFGDGRVCVVDAEDLPDAPFLKVDNPIATLRLDSEPGIKATAMSWVNMNRLAVGYSDGSIGLWSIQPKHLISRHPVHHNDITSLVSGYPTLPYVVASAPIGGNIKLVDLSAPSLEVSELIMPLVSTQPGLMAYSDHLLGFVTLYPSSSPLNTTVGLCHYAHFPVFRRVFTGNSLPTCVAVGRRHPYLLVGLMDGSLHTLCPPAELFNARGEVSDRMRLFHHEHRPKSLFPSHSPNSTRGASRILQGYKPERNRNPRSELQSNKKAANKKSKARAAGGDDEVEGFADPRRLTTYEALTRVTCVEWNGSDGFGCWAAVGMGSGLVRVMDLGLDVKR